MKELTGVNLFQFNNICVTTNGDTRKDGLAVMGRGVAYTAAHSFPGIQKSLAESLLLNGNHVSYLGEWGKFKVIAFPTKGHWMHASSIELIMRSCVELEDLITKLNLETVWLPRPGCSNGQLVWEDVRMRISNLLSDRVVVITNER